MNTGHYIWSSTDNLKVVWMKNKSIQSILLLNSNISVSQYWPSCYFSLCLAVHFTCSDNLPWQACNWEKKRLSSQTKIQIEISRIHLALIQQGLMISGWRILAWKFKCFTFTFGYFFLIFWKWECFRICLTWLEWIPRRRYK